MKRTTKRRLIRAGAAVGIAGALAIGSGELANAYKDGAPIGIRPAVREVANKYIMVKNAAGRAAKGVPYRAAGAGAAAWATYSMAKGRPKTKKELAAASAIGGAIFPTPGLVAGGMVLSYKAWKKLTPKQQKGIKDAAKRHAQQAQDALKRKNRN